jgi:hypothetical protein
MDWAKAVTDRQALRQALIAQEEQDRERAEERKKKDAKRCHSQTKAKRPINGTSVSWRWRECTTL